MYYSINWKYLSLYTMMFLCKKVVLGEFLILFTIQLMELN